MNISDLEKNCYGYDKLIKTGSLRFTTYDDHTLIKVNKDRIDKYNTSFRFRFLYSFE